MKLVYLDTSHIAVLSRAWSQKSKSIRAFVRKWKASDLGLALSQIHLAEISEHKSEKTRQERYSFLEILLPIFLDAGSFIEKEILNALIRKNVLTEVSRADFFATRVKHKEEIQEISQRISSDFFRDMFNMLATAQEFSWEAEKVREYEPLSRKRRVEDLPDDASFNSNFDEVKTILERYEEDIENRLPPNLKEIYKMQFRDIYSQIDDFARKAEREGYRKSLSELAGFDISNRKSRHRPVEDVFREYRFGLFVAQTAHAHGLPVDIVKKEIVIEDCPSYWLCDRVRKRLLQAGDASPNNEYDLEHLQYLRLVDMFLTDKRVVNKVNQVLCEPDLIAPLKSVAAPISTSNSIEAIATALFE